MFCDILISFVTFFVIFGGLTDKQTDGPIYLRIEAPSSYFYPFQTSDKKTFNFNLSFYKQAVLNVSTKIAVMTSMALKVSMASCL